MTWATKAIESLKKGDQITLTPHGNSMKPLIHDGDKVTIIPMKDEPRPSDIVLCKIRGKEYLHIVKAVSGNRYLIGNNRGNTNGWIGINSIYGRVIKVEPK